MSEKLDEFMARIYDEKDLEKFNELKDYLDKHSNNYSKQETFLFAVRMAHEGLTDLKDSRNSVESKLP